jgi:DNA-binding CsgD family transcriptional regulator
MWKRVDPSFGQDFMRREVEMNAPADGSSISTNWAADNFLPPENSGGYSPPKNLSEAIPGTASPLSTRQRAVLEWIGRGKSNKEIAKDLGITPETVKSHVKNIFAKLAVGRRAQAVARAQSLGIIKMSYCGDGPCLDPD